MVSWFRDPELLDAEQILFRRSAHIQQGWRTVGGEVTVTDRRFLFLPNQFEYATGGRTVDWPRSTITGTQRIPPGRGQIKRGGLGASFRTRLEVTSTEGSILLTITDTAALVAALGTNPA